MVVRIRFGKGPKLGKRRKGNQRIARCRGGCLRLAAALIASRLAVWRIAADLNVANSFAIPSGLFSHWQVWLGAAVGLQLCSRVLNRYGKGRDAAIS